MNIIFRYNFVCYGRWFRPRMNGQGEFVMVDDEDLLGLEIQNDFFEVFRRSVDVFPIGIVLSVLQDRQINSPAAFVYLRKKLVISSVSADIDLASSGFHHKRCPQRLITFA